jgi:hypothetical protein
VNATEDFASLLHAVPDHATVAVRANRRQRMDRALKAIKRVVFSGNNYVKRLVIVIFANFAFSHT